MDASKKTILFSIAGAVVASIVVQQIAYRNSMEFKIRSYYERLSRSQVNQEEDARFCLDEGNKMSATNPYRLAQIYLKAKDPKDLDYPFYLAQILKAKDLAKDLDSLTPYEERIYSCLMGEDPLFVPRISRLVEAVESAPSGGSGSPTND
jgi:hypothetical protein